MARGKCAAQAASRRANEAQERITELEIQLNDERNKHRAELQELKTDRDRARAQLAREVKELAGQQIQAAKATAAQEVAEARRTVGSRCKDVVSFLSRNTLENGWDMTSELWDELSTLTGVSVVDLVNATPGPPVESNRAGRRAVSRSPHSRGCRCGGCANNAGLILCDTPIR